MDLKHLKVWLEEVALAIEDAHEVDCEYVYHYWNKRGRFCDCRMEKARGIVALILNKVEKEIENVK